jgi:2-oxoisovalerate dehydrogenase E1 component
MATQSTKSLSKQGYLDLYRVMVTIRLTEEKLAESHQQGLIHGACHTYVGEEAIAPSVCAHLSQDDVVFSTHRGHGHALSKGVTSQQLIAELYGRAEGISLGRGGSMHLFAPEVGLMGTSGIVGPCILQAVGAGYTFKLTDSSNVGVAFFGDGAVNNGAFHEGLNLASIWDLPVLFICENNQFATEVPFKDSSGNASVGNRGPAYGMPSHELDGNDAELIHAVAGEAIERARAGEGPTLIECKTYRTRAHAEGMSDFSYRTRDDVAEWKKRCPIARLRLAAIGSFPELEDGLNLIDAEIAESVAAAHQAAEAAAWPDPETVDSHIYALASDPTTPRDEPLQHGFATDQDDTRQLTYMAATHEGLAEMMEEDPLIFVLGEGIGARGGNFNTTTGLYDIHGAVRLRDTPIAERGFVGLGCGAAMTGSRPVIDFMFADFILDAVGELVNQIAKMQYMSSGRLSMPILLRGCVGIGHSAATHHSGNYYPMYSQVPGLRVIVPSTAYDAKGLLKTALRSNDPVIMLEHRELLSVKGPVPEGDYEIPFGVASIVREGTDVTVVALAQMVHRTMSVCGQLAADGIEVELIDPRTTSPLDTDTIIASVRKTGRLLVIDEAYGPCGIGAEILATVADDGFDDLDAPLKRLNCRFTPIPYSPPLEAAVVPQADQIERTIRELVAE